MSMKNSSYTIGNWTCDHPAYSTVPQPNVPPHTCGGIGAKFWTLRELWFCFLVILLHGISWSHCESLSVPQIKFLPLPVGLVSCFYFMTEAEPAPKMLYIKWYRWWKMFSTCAGLYVYCVVFYTLNIMNIYVSLNHMTSAPLQVRVIWLPCRM